MPVQAFVLPSICLLTTCATSPVFEEQALLVLYSPSLNPHCIILQTFKHLEPYDSS